MILIAAGSSLPFCGIDSQQIVLGAFLAIGRWAPVLAVSPLFDAPAWPAPADPRFVNAVASIETGLAPEALLAALHAVEAGFGRRRLKKNAPRTLDLDLLDYHGLRSGSGGLTLPHPRLSEREFVLAPLAEVAPDWRHPETGRRAQEMLDCLPERVTSRIS